MTLTVSEDCVKIQTERNKGSKKITLTSTEFRRNLNHYYSVVESEDIKITTNGKVIAVLTTPASKRLQLARSLYGIIPSVDDETRKNIRGERLAKL